MQCGRNMAWKNWKRDAEAVSGLTDLRGGIDGTAAAGRCAGGSGNPVAGSDTGNGSICCGQENILIWLIVLGILSALLIHFVEVFDKHQIADLSFYFIYLLMGVILLQCFPGFWEPQERRWKISCCL